MPVSIKRALATSLLGTMLALTGFAAYAAPGAPGPLTEGDHAWTQPGEPLPALDGASYPLDHWKGKVVLLNFWASWCSPCQYEIPSLVRMQSEHGWRGLQIIGIGVDREKPLRNVSRSLRINYPVLVAEGDLGRDLLTHWGDKSQIVPYNVVIGRDGRIHFAQQGQFDRDMFEEYIAPLLATP